MKVEIILHFFFATFTIKLIFIIKITFVFTKLNNNNLLIMANLKIGSLQHKRSSVVNDKNGIKTPKLPTKEQLEFGEIAINYAKDYETLSIKNSSGDVVTFSSDSIIDKKIDDIRDDLASVVSVELGEDTNDNKNFLKSENESGDTQVLAVRAIDANATKLKNKIVVAGIDGQLGAGNYKNGDEIDAGTDIQTILQNILSKELYATPSNTIGTMTASIDKPTVSLDNSGTVEVGTLITMNSATVTDSKVATTPQKVDSMTYGYSVADDDKADSTGTIISKSWTTAATGGAYKMSATVNGFNADPTTHVQQTPATVSAKTMPQTVLGCAVEGNNTITVSVTGDTFTGSVDGIDSVYYCSNLGHTDAAKKTTAIAAINDKVSNTPTNSQTVTVRGVYKYFLGYSTNKVFNQFTSASVRALTTRTGDINKDDTTTIVDSTKISSNGNSIVVACPSTYKLATVENGIGASILANFSSVGEVNVETGSITTKYKVYVYPVIGGAVVEFKNVTLTKA